MADAEDSRDSTASQDSTSWPSGQAYLQPLTMHDRVGPFELVDFLGRGGMGQVYKARDTRLGRIIALKVLSPTPGASEERFQREARAQAKIDHEGVCRVYEVGTSEGRGYIAMQFLEGKTLAEVADELTLEEKVSVVHQIAEAVQAAHRQALVHRDLKPGNIMIRRIDGEIKAWVLDFGMVRMAGDSRLTLTGEVVGTPLYMAPEQVEGDQAAIDRRTDVYSLGAILYRLLTGRPPIEGKSVLELLGRIGRVEPVPPRQLRPNVPEDLEWITLRCLEKEPGRRYASARALIEDLDSFRAGEPVNARQSTLRYLLTKKAHKHRHTLIIGSLLALLLAGLFWRDSSQRRDAAQATRLAAKYLSQVEQIEWRTRLMAALPLHDTRPETNALLAELEALEREVEASGEIAKGPGLFALGRGYHVLGELDRGLEYLERAWESGNRDPMLSFDLGLAYGEKYYERLLYSRLAADPKVRQQVVEDAESRYKAPAVEHFQRAKRAGAGDSAWAEALLATYEGHSDAALEALAALDEDDAVSSWRYETHVLRSNIWHDRANQSVDLGDFEAASNQISKAVETLAIAREIGQSDSRVLAAFCKVNMTRTFIEDDERVASAEGRQALLEPCLRAIEADSGSVNALAMAADMANQLAVRLLWLGDAEARTLFARSTEWAEQAVSIDPEEIRAANLLPKNSANLGFLAETPEERKRLLVRSLEQARRAVAIAPTDLDAVLSLADIASLIASETSLLGEDVEPLFEEAATALQPLLRQPSPASAILACHASLEVKRAKRYLARGGDAEASLARARSSMDALDPNAALGDYEAWISIELCSAEASLAASKGEAARGLADCRDLSAERVRAAPTDLEWAILDAKLSMLAIRHDPSELRALQPRIEDVLRRLQESEIQSNYGSDALLGTWKVQLARLGEAEERIPRLEEAIEAFSRSILLEDDLENRLNRVDAQLFLAELERLRGRTDVTRSLLQESRLGLAHVMDHGIRPIRLRLMQAAAGHIEARLGAPMAAPTSGATTITVDPEAEARIDWVSLHAEPYLRSDMRWWQAFLEQADV